MATDNADRIFLQTGPVSARTGQGTLVSILAT